MNHFPQSNKNRTIRLTTTITCDVAVKGFDYRIVEKKREARFSSLRKKGDQFFPSSGLKVDQERRKTQRGRRLDLLRSKC